MAETRERQTCIRFREHDVRALDEARGLTRESFSAFVRRSALEKSRELLGSHVWLSDQQRQDNATIDAITESLGSSE